MILTDTVPVPEAQRRSLCSWPFEEMQVGDSFTVTIAERARTSVAATRYSKRNPGWKYTTRAMGDSIRLWRTA